MDERSAIDPGFEDAEPKQPPSIEWFRCPDTEERPAEFPEHAQKSLTHWPRRIVGRFLRWIDNRFVRHSSRSVKIHVGAGHAKTPRPYTFENVDTVRAIRLPQLAIAPRIVHHNDAAGWQRTSVFLIPRRASFAATISHQCALSSTLVTDLQCCAKNKVEPPLPNSNTCISLRR